MKSTRVPVSGFTVIKNGILMGYPVVESIRSLLPIVDEFVVAVGQSDDDTRTLIAAIGDPKIRIIDTIWDPTKTKGGLMLSEKTNEALALCKNDWCFYIQADEVVHEDDYEMISTAIGKAQAESEIEGLLFKYLHFYGSYDSIATSRNWYRNEVRVIRRSSGAQSHNDAQGFRVHGEKPKVLKTPAQIYHYGWVKPPAKMGQKSKLLNRWWHGNKRDHEFDNFEYDRQYGLRPFVGTHPKVMQILVASQNWKFSYQRSLADWTLKDINLLASDIFEKVFRFRIGEYKPYRIVQQISKK
jgi:glycosyltransferase involved in cell wall biosynthesis